MTFSVFDQLISQLNGPFSVVLNELLPDLSRYLVIGTLLFALADCFFGLRIFRFKCGVAGFFLFALMGACFIQNVTEELLWMFAMLLAVGIIGAVLGYRLFKLGVFLCCFLSVYYLAQTLLGSTLSFWPTLILSLLASVLLAILGMKCTRHVLILTSAVSGASAAADALPVLLGQNFDQMTLWMITGILLGLGLLLQYHQNKRA